MEDQDNLNVVWFIAGAAIGASLALLFAPQSGEETRSFIRKKAERGREFIDERGRDLADRGRDLFERGRKIADEAAELFEKGKKLADG
jgi:gas vesicle protein